MCNGEEARDGVLDKELIIAAVEGVAVGIQIGGGSSDR